MIKAMIVSVGGTPAPIIKAICEYKPEFISFLASQDTCDLVGQIRIEVNKTTSTSTGEITLVDDINDLFHCYNKAEEAVARVITKGYKRDDIIVDYTGGTKNMSVALALAAVSHGVSFSYVGGKERSKNGVGIVLNGQEKIYSSINPWDFLAIEERKNIAILYNQYQFKAAKNLADKLLEKSTKYRSLYRKISFLIDGYNNWDLFRHQDAIDCFKRAKIDEIMESADKPIKVFAEAAGKQLHFLQEIVKDNKKPSVFLILDIFSNADRRFEEGKIDDAILRLYRLVELMAQERLYNQYQILASDVKEEEIPESLREHFIKTYRSQPNEKIQIPQAAAFKLLDAMNDDLGKIYTSNKSDFLKIQSSRNYSYLAHGFESSKEATYLKLKEFILKLNMFKADHAPKFPKIEL